MLFICLYHGDLYSDMWKGDLYFRPPPKNAKMDQTWDFIFSKSKIKSKNRQRGQAGE